MYLHEMRVSALYMANDLMISAVLQLHHDSSGYSDVLQLEVAWWTMPRDI